MPEDIANKTSDNRVEEIICAVVFASAIVVAAWLRFYDISIKPFHHDEGVNSHFLLNLARSGQYKYDPTNYHGPTLYFFSLVSVWIFGENDLALRLVPAIFGVLMVAMVWLLRRQLGTFGTPVAAFCMALSPCLVYFSRDFIHEITFGCFSLGIVIGAWRYAESKRFFWLAIGAVSTGLLFATKETAIITIVVFIIAIVCAALWDATRALIRQKQFSAAALVKKLKDDTAAVLPSLDHTVAALIIFVFINVIFYSSFFIEQPKADGSKGVHWQGVRDAVESFFLWTKRSGTEHVKHLDSQTGEKEWWYYLYYIGILFKLELPLLVGSLLAGVIVIWRGTLFWLFVAAWTLGMTLAYSIIGYKTPWLMISFVMPMTLICGYAAEQVYRLLPWLPLRLLWLAVVAVALVASGRMAWKVNFEKYDDNGNATGYFAEFFAKHEFKPYVDGLYGYVYAQTDRDFTGLIEELKRETDRLATKEHTGIYVAAPEHWPLPWYLRDYDRVAYTGSWPGAEGGALNITQPIIIANVDQQSNLDGVPGWRTGLRAYKLRPGVELILFVRHDVPPQ